MSEPLTILPRPISPPVQRSSAATVGKNPSGQGFESILNAKLDKGDIRFSSHAQSRMEQRGIVFTPDQSQRLTEAVARVSIKGGRESLVLIDNLAMVVSVRNQTVVTVAEQEQLKANVFTNIDSAVIA